MLPKSSFRRTVSPSSRHREFRFQAIFFGTYLPDLTTIWIFFCSDLVRDEWTRTGLRKSPSDVRLNMGITNSLRQVAINLEKFFMFNHSITWAGYLDYSS